MKKDFDMQNIGVFLFLSVFSLFCSKEDLKSKKYGVVLFSPSVLKNGIIRRHDSTHGTAYYERYCIFTAYFLVVFWLFQVVFDNDEGVARCLCNS